MQGALQLVLLLPQQLGQQPRQVPLQTVLAWLLEQGLLWLQMQSSS
jgi:hypothetical protein